MNRTTRASDDAGFALAVVLAFLLLAGTIATPFFLLARQYAFVSRNAVAAVRRATAAEGMLQLAAQRYMEHARVDDRLPSRVECRMEAPSGQIDFLFHFQNHAGLIDLNAASPELMQIGFASLGADNATAEKLAALADTYRSANITGIDDNGSGIVGGPKHSAFETVSELFDFPLPAATSREDLESVFTVLSRSGFVDRGSASSRLKDAFALRSTGELPFLIEDAQSAPAVTVSFRSGSRGTPGASAVYVYDSSDKPATHHGPIRTAIMPVDLTRTPTGPATDCETFFESTSLTLLKELMQ